MVRKNSVHLKSSRGNDKDHLFTQLKGDFTRENFIEGAIIRPGILFISFMSFIAALFMLALGNFKWSGSLVIVAFVLNMYTIYQSLKDEPSIFRTVNLVFKITLFMAEIIAINWILILITY